VFLYRMSGLNLEPVNEQSDSLEESSDVQSSWSLSSRDQEIKPTASQKIRGNLKVTSTLLLINPFRVLSLSHQISILLSSFNKSFESLRNSNSNKIKISWNFAFWKKILESWCERKEFVLFVQFEDNPYKSDIVLFFSQNN
jgi:hypothetical protein